MQCQVGHGSRTGGIGLTCKQNDVCLVVVYLSVLRLVNGLCHSISGLQVGDRRTHLVVAGLYRVVGVSLNGGCHTRHGGAGSGLGLTRSGGPHEEEVSVGDTLGSGDVHDHGASAATVSHVLLGLLVQHDALDGRGLRAVPAIHAQGDIGAVRHAEELSSKVGHRDACGNGNVQTHAGGISGLQRVLISRSTRLGAPQLGEALGLDVLHGLLCLRDHVLNSVVGGGIQSIGGTTVVDVVQTTQRSHVTVGVEGLHGGHVCGAVHNLELEVHGVVVADAQLTQRHRDHHLVFLDLVSDGLVHGSKLVGVVGTGVLGHGGHELSLGSIVDDVIVTVPTGAVVTVDIDVHLHPGVLGCSRDHFGSLDVEIHVLGIRGDLGCHDIVTAGLVGVDLERLRTITDVVTVGSVALRIGVGQDDILPLIEGTGHVDGITLVLNDVGSGTLCLLDIGNQLHVVVVEVVALRHLHITGELDGCGINELSLLVRVSRVLGGLGALAVVVGCDPLVPTGDQDVLDVLLSERIVELLLEVVAVIATGLIIIPCSPLTLQVVDEIRLGELHHSGIRNAVGRGAVGLVGTATVHLIVAGLGSRIRELTGTAVLCKRHADRALLALSVGVHFLRPVEVHPRPGIVVLAHVVGQVFVQSVIRPLGLLHGEEVRDRRAAAVGFRDQLGQRVGSCNHNRLTVNAEPGVGIEVLGVDISVDLSDTQDTVGVGVEHHLGHVVALIAVLLENAHERKSSVGVRVIVGDIEVQEVNACVHQKLDVLAVNVGIVTVIVAVEGLCEPVHVVARTHRAVGVAAVGLQGRLQVIRLTDGSVCTVVHTVPEEVEHTNVLLLLGTNGGNTVLACLGEGAAQIVHTCITAEEVVIVVGNDVGLGLLKRRIVVADGDGLAVCGGSVGQGTLSGVQSGGVIVHVLGRGGPCVVRNTHGLQLTDSGEVHADTALHTMAVVVDVDLDVGGGAEIGGNADLRVVGVAAGHVDDLLVGITAVFGDVQDPTVRQRAPAVRGVGGLQTDRAEGVLTAQVNGHVDGILFGDVHIVDFRFSLEVQTTILVTVDQCRGVPLTIVNVTTVRHGDVLVQRNVAQLTHKRSLVARQCVCREGHDRTCDRQNEQHAQSHRKECEKSLFHCEKLLSNLENLGNLGILGN